MKPKAPTTGWVDGGWWPRSRDLAAVRKISFGGGVVRLAGYRSQHAETVDVLAAQQRVTLLVVSPEATAQTAHAALMAAGHRGNSEDVEALRESGLFTAPVLDGAGGEPDAARQRWELDGGHVYEPAGVRGQ